MAVSSLAGISGVPARTGYSASKHAMMGFFESPQIELKGSGVTVTIVAPNFFLSEIHRRVLDSSGNPFGESPMQESKIMKADECAALIVKAMENFSTWSGEKEPPSFKMILYYARISIKNINKHFVLPVPAID